MMNYFSYGILLLFLLIRNALTNSTTAPTANKPKISGNLYSIGGSGDTHTITISTTKNNVASKGIFASLMNLFSFMMVVLDLYYIDTNYLVNAIGDWLWRI